MLRIRLQEFRQARGWSQTELGKRAGIQQAMISRLETKKTRRLDLNTLERLADALEVDPALLIIRDPSRG